MSINKIKKYAGHTPLYYASKHKHPECTELLLFYRSPMDQLVNGGNLVDMLITSFRDIIELECFSKEINNKWFCLISAMIFQNL